MVAALHDKLVRLFRWLVAKKGLDITCQGKWCLLDLEDYCEVVFKLSNCLGIIAMHHVIPLVR
jgi:hypothetical protein